MPRSSGDRLIKAKKTGDLRKFENTYTLFSRGFSQNLFPKLYQNEVLAKVPKDIRVALWFLIGK